jgi:hypothetical protein
LRSEQQDWAFGKATMSAPESQIVCALKQYLLGVGLGGATPSRVLVDADPSYIHSRWARELEPMARVEIGGARPDLLCSFERTQGVLVTAFEVKAASSDWPQGLAQARRYRTGVHYSYLALPGEPSLLKRQLGAMARETGVGVLVLHQEVWHEIIRPTEPIPLPWTLSTTIGAVDGVPLARQLQLNHPLNYLVVPFFTAARLSGHTVFEELEARWPDLKSDGTRKHAVLGAITLRLIDAKFKLTVEGRTVADLLLALGFEPERRPPKRERLADVAPPLAALARFVFLQQPAVQLILRILGGVSGALTISSLAIAAVHLDPPLGSALFLSDPSAEIRPDLPGVAYNPTTVFKLKQNLWHAGLLETPRHPSAGKRAADFRPSQDHWQMSAHLVR